MVVGLLGIGIWKGVSAEITQPDLSTEITFSPSHPAVGEVVEITFTLHNLGTAYAGGFYAYFYLDPNQTTPTSTTAPWRDTFIGIPIIPDDPVDYTYTTTFTEEGFHPVYAWLDRANAITELDEDNNLEGPIYIPVGDIGDSHEPDDSCATATLLPPDTLQTHTFNLAPDDDWVQFELQDGVTYRLHSAAVGSDAAPRIAVYRACDTITPIFSDEASHQWTAMVSDTYFARIINSQATAGIDSTYTVQLDTLTACQGHFEPNNSCEVAQLLLPDESEQTHDFCTSADVDWVQIPVIAGHSYRVRAFNDGINANAKMFFETTCEAPAQSAGIIEDIRTAAQDGFFYYRILNSDVLTAGTNYRLSATDLGECNLDAHEPDDIAPRSVSVGASWTHNICPASDRDWVQFYAFRNSVYLIETRNLGESADTVVCLYNNDVIEIECDDDGGNGLASRLVWKATETGTFRVRVTHSDIAATGDTTQYDLRIATSLCQPDMHEPDDTRATAKLHSTTSHTICASTDNVRGDADWIAISVTAGIHTIETTSIGTAVDTVIALYDVHDTLLSSNDDSTHHGTARITHHFTEPATVYLKVHHYSPVAYGSGTEYKVKVYAGAPPPVPTPQPTPERPLGSKSNIKTLILYNETRMAQKFGIGPAVEVRTQLTQLANDLAVQGEVFDLDQNDTIKAAYSDWSNNVESANQVARAIRGVLMSNIDNYPLLENIVIIGPDDVIPFYRQRDLTPGGDSEQNYAGVIDTHPTGLAVRSNYFLTDEFYGDVEIERYAGQFLHVSDFAIGRLVEKPSEIINFTVGFMEPATNTLDAVLITGYDFVTDSAEAQCAAWRELSLMTVDCDLIGEDWTEGEYASKRDASFIAQAIFGHADHYREGVPVRMTAAPPFGAPESSGSLSATELSALSVAWRGGLVYTPSCHSGLNLPDENPNEFDLPQLYSQKGVNYIANTGYGWGYDNGIGLSERLLQLFTEELLTGNYSIGTALMRAKHRYINERSNEYSAYHSKVVQELTLYGLPMTKLELFDGHSVENDVNPFPSINFNSRLQGTFGPSELLTATVTLTLSGTLTTTDLPEGALLELDGSAERMAGRPTQPIFWIDVEESSIWQLRGGLLLSATYTTLQNFDPVVAAPVNQYVPIAIESMLVQDQWFSGNLLTTHTNGGVTRFVIQMGQFHSATQVERVIQDVGALLFYSSSDDYVPPVIGDVTSFYDSGNHKMTIKVAVEDGMRVLITYTDGNGLWTSADLTPNDAGTHWTGTFEDWTADTVFYLQAADTMGNVAVETNKDRYFQPADLCALESSVCSDYITSVQVHKVTSRGSSPFVWAIIVGFLILTMGTAYSRKAY